LSANDNKSDLPWQQLLNWHNATAHSEPKIAPHLMRLPVQVGFSWLALPLVLIDRALDSPQVRHLPGSDAALLGYCASAGQALPVWKLSTLLDMAEQPDPAFYLLSHEARSRVLAVEAVGRPFSVTSVASDSATAKLLSVLQIDPGSLSQEFV